MSNEILFKMLMGSLHAYRIGAGIAHMGMGAVNSTLSAPLMMLTTPLATIVAGEQMVRRAQALYDDPAQYADPKVLVFAAADSVLNGLDIAFSPLYPGLGKMKKGVQEIWA